MTRLSVLGYLRAGLGIAILTYVVYLFDAGSVTHVIASLDILWLIPCSVAIIASTLIGAMNLYLLLKQKISLSLREFTTGYWLAWAVGLVVPGQVGDIASISIWMKKHGYDWVSTGTTALVDKVITLSWTLVLSAVALIPLAGHNSVQLSKHWIVLAVTAGSCLVLLLAVVIRRPRYQAVIKKIVKTLKYQVTQNKKTVMINILITPIKLSFIAFAYWAAFRAAGIDTIGIAEIVPLVCLSSLVAYIPISFNGLGTVEWAGGIVFGYLAIKASTTVAVYLTLRITVMTLAWIPVAIYLLCSPKTQLNQ